MKKNKPPDSKNSNFPQDVINSWFRFPLNVMLKTFLSSGRSRQNFDLVLSEKNLAKNEVFVHFQSNLEILTGFQKPCDLVWICHSAIQKGSEKS